jgi:hypothetical protein
MVDCTKCGSRNPDEANYCINCGSDLEAPREGGWEKRLDKWGEDMEEWGEDFGKRMEEECFGLGRTPNVEMIIGIAFGFFLIIIGVALLSGQDILRWIGPSAAIIIGILIIIAAIYGKARRR